jgi:hypothetical protein
MSCVVDVDVVGAWNVEVLSDVLLLLLLFFTTSLIIIGKFETLCSVVACDVIALGCLAW